MCVCTCVCAEEVEMASPSSLVSGAWSSHSLWPAIKHPSFVSGLHLLPASTLSVSRLSTCHVSPPSRASSQMELCFKTPNFRDPMAWTLTYSLGEGLTEQWPGAGLPQKAFFALVQQQNFRDYGKNNTQPAPGFATLSHLCTNISKCDYSLRSAGTFSCGEYIWSLLNALQVGEPLLSMWYTDPSDYTACFWGFTLLPHQSTSKHWALKLHIFPPLFIESFFLPINGFREQISCSVLCRRF